MASIVSPGSGRRTMIWPPFELAEIEGVQRLPALHQHVVADVDHVVDRRDADVVQSPDQPRRARPALHAAHHPSRIAQAQVRALDPHVRPATSPAAHPPAAARPASSTGGSKAPPISRAMPRWPKQSGRLLVTSRSMARSSPTAGALVVQPGHHQPSFELLAAACPGHVLFQPIPGNDHGEWSIVSCWLSVVTDRGSRGGPDIHPSFPIRIDAQKSNATFV